MRIGYDGRHASFAGIGRFTSDLWTALRSIEPGVVALVNPPDRGGFLGDHAVALAPPTSRVRSRPFRPTEQVELPLALRRMNADVFHSPHFDLPFATRVPVVITVHDLFPLHYPEHSRSRATATYSKVFLPLAIRRAARIVAISQHTYDDIQQTFGVGDDRLRLVRHGLDHDRWQPPAADAIIEVRRRLGLPERYLLHVGATKWHKNLRSVIDALTPDLPALVCAGPSTDDVAAHADLAGCDGTVLALGAVSDDDLRALYAGAVAVVVASRYEAVSLPALEAMAIGTPLVTSNGGALPETVGDAALQVDPLDVAGWTDALRQISEDAGLRATLVARGRDRVAQRSWTRCAQEYVAVYREVARDGTT